MKKPKNRENPKDPFYPREKRHVRGMKTPKNKSGAKIHPALIIGEKQKNYFSMGMTTKAPLNAKSRKKVIPLEQHSEDGKRCYLSKRIQERKRVDFSPEIYGEFRLTKKEHSEIDKCIEKKRRFIHDHEGDKKGAGKRKKTKKKEKNNL